MTSLAAAASLATAKHAIESPKRAHASFKDALLSPSRTPDAETATGLAISSQGKLSNELSPAMMAACVERQALTAHSTSADDDKGVKAKPVKKQDAASDQKAPQTPRRSASNSFCPKV